MAGVFWAVYVLWFACELFIFSRDRAPVAGVNRDGSSRRVIVAGMVGSIMLATAVARVRWAATPWPRADAVGIGAMLMLAGIAFRLWAVSVLGEHFRTQVTLLDGHRLIRSGPYARLRHPAYTGSLVSCLGLGIALANWCSLLVMIVGPFAGFAWRVAIEERAMGERFGADWRAYRARSWAMLPVIW